MIWEASEKIHIDRVYLGLREHTFVSCAQTLPSVKIDYSWLINVWRWKWWVIPATMSHEELWDDTGTGLWWEDSDSIVIMWLFHHLSQTPGLDNLKAFKLNMNEKIRIVQLKFRQNHESTNIDIFKIIFSWECLFLYFISSKTHLSLQICMIEHLVTYLSLLVVLRRQWDQEPMIMKYKPKPKYEQVSDWS